MKMAMKAAVAAACLAAWSLSASADTVYLKNGTTRQGKVTRSAGKVTIQMPMGATIEVNESDIVAVVADSTPASAPSREPTGEPAALDAGSGFVLQKAGQPEPIIFMLMRNFASTRDPSVSMDLRQQIERWRMMAHDRKRQSGGNWIGPADFDRARSAFLAYLKEADELFVEARKPKPEVTAAGGTSSRYTPVPLAKPADKKDKDKNDAPAAFAKLRQAAQTWVDPLMRVFLLGAAEYEAKDYYKAESLFRQCVDQAPRVAIFRQGHGLALMEINRPLDALAEFTQALRLEPNSREALRLVRAAMVKAPGSDARSPVYVAAEKLASQYPEAGGSSSSGGSLSSSSPPTGITWLMPGKELHVKSDTLPTPPFDRLSFRQAVAVPVGTNLLMVDSAAVKDATDILVQIDAKTLVPAEIKRVTSTTRGKPLPPLSLLAVSGYSFTPLKADKSGSGPGSAVAHGLGFYGEMGSEPRQFSVQARQDGGETKVAPGLSAGEAAAPVVTGEGELIGFLAGRTNAAVDNGGPDQLIGVDQLEPLLKQAARPAGTFGGGYNRAKRVVATQPASGQTFVIHAIVGEKLQP